MIYTRNTVNASSGYCWFHALPQGYEIEEMPFLDVIPFLQMRDPNLKSRYLMIIHSKEDGHAIGASGMSYEEESDTWRFSYSIRYDDWGKGYATEATRAMMDYVITQYEAHRFEAECAKENVGSARVMEKLGMTFLKDASYSKLDGSVTFESGVYVKELR